MLSFDEVGKNAEDALFHLLYAKWTMTLPLTGSCGVELYYSISAEVADKSPSNNTGHQIHFTVLIRHLCELQTTGEDK